MEKKDKIRMMLLTEETVCAVERSLQALDAILEKVFQSATQPDERLLKLWAAALAHTTASYTQTIQAERAALLQIMAIDYHEDNVPTDRERIRAELTERIDDMEVTDD